MKKKFSFPELDKIRKNKIYFDNMREKEKEEYDSLSEFERLILHGAKSDICDNCHISVVHHNGEWIDDFNGPECPEYNSSRFNPKFQFHIVEEEND